MRDINLNSRVLRLIDFPADTTKIMIMYDERGWAIRCYNDKSNDNKITTMIQDEKLGDSESDVTLVRRETL